MADTIRFPQESGPESALVVTLYNAVAVLPHAGGIVYPSIAAFRTSGLKPAESPFISLVIEFSSDVPVTLGDGVTNQVGLYGEIEPVNSPPIRMLLGMLGYAFTSGNLPQIITSQTALPSQVGVAQIIQAEAAFDRLSVGGVTGDIATGGALVTVKVRPLIVRGYLG